MSADRTVTVRITRVYGKEAIYPVCDTAQTFAAMCRTKTLSHADLIRIRTLGFDVVVEQQSICHSLALHASFERGALKEVVS